MANKILPSLIFLLAASLAAVCQPLVHVVQKGETLYGIAKRYDVRVEDLVSLNGIKDPARVLPGTSLTIPGKTAVSREHTVQKGDTLYSIARRYGVAVQDIVALNALGGTTIVPGQKLKLPGQATADSGAPTAPVAVPPAAVPRASGPTDAAKPVAPVLAEAGKWPASGELSFLQGKLKGVAISVKPGASMSAIRSGTVVSAGPFRSFGQVAFVQSNDGLVYVYGGASALKVRVGDAIRKGAVVGTAEPDADGSAFVYFFVFKGADSLDPVSVPRD